MTTTTTPAAANQEGVLEDKPRTFTDKAGRTWDVSLTLLACRRVDNSDFSELTSKKFSILEPTREFFMEILTDTPLLFGIVWAIVQPQVKGNLGIDIHEPDISPEERTRRAADAEEAFLEALDGRTVREGRDAVWGAVADFFPEHRTALLTLMTQYQKGHQRIGAELAGMEADIETLIGEEITAGMKTLKKDLQDLRTPAAKHGKKSQG